MSRNKSNGPKRLFKLLPLLLLVAACATGALQEKMLSMPSIDGATYIGNEACADCHEEVSNRFAGNVHGRLADFELNGWQKGCESCHGKASLHVNADGDPAKILNPAKLDSAEAEALCVGCHTGGSLMEWTFGEHALSNVSCTDCHLVHGEGALGADLKKSDPELCYECHQEEMAKANFPSHHPINEGKMSCSDCHNPHGELQTEELARDLCLECHARYTGPFVYEHAPVEEDCNICHDPHGTVANNLLQQNEPFLCLQCHESHFHASRIGADPGTIKGFSFDANKVDELQAAAPGIYDVITGTGSYTTVTNSPGTVFSGPLTPAEANTIIADLIATDPTAYTGPSDVTINFTNQFGQEGWRRAFLTKCTTCHTVMHGSDLPSQSAPAFDANGDGFPDGGHGLTR